MECAISRANFLIPALAVSPIFADISKTVLAQCPITLTHWG